MMRSFSPTNRKDAAFKRKAEPIRKRRDPFNGKDVIYLDYKETKLLERFINDQGKILPRRITAVSAKNQRRVTEAIKRARHMALLPFVGEGLR